MKKDLLTILAELSANASEEDRERFRTAIQQSHQDSASRLSTLVRDHRENLSHSVQTCSRIISTVSESKERCRSIKERITNCMAMLQVNRDNVRRMWLESLQHKYAHKILSEIEELRKIPRIVNASLFDKKLEHATDVIVNSVKLLDGPQCSADALKELKTELHSMQKKLYVMVLEDLRKHLHLTDFLDYFSKCSDDLRFDDIFTHKIPKSDYYFKDVLNQISSDKPYVQVLLNCVATMRRLPETISFLKDNCQKDLESMACQVSKFMYDVIQHSIDVSTFELPVEKQQIFLIDLVESIFCVFMKVADHYKNFFDVFCSVRERSGMTDIEFHLDDIYSKIQAAVEYFLGHYFDPQSTALTPKESFVFSSSADIGAYFSPQSFTEDTCLNLFKFTDSLHGVSRKKYSREAKVLSSELDGEISDKPEKMHLVCRPALKNVTLIFSPLNTFISEIEQVFSVESIDCTPLYSFMCDSTNLFLDQINGDITKMLQNVYVNLEAWNTAYLGDYSTFRVSSEKQILSCSFMLENILKELENLLTCLPDYSNHFLRLVYFVILDYKEMYTKAFKQMFEEEQNFLSVSWARDRDVRRFMKSFLNWRHLADGKVVDSIESPEEIRIRNKQESDLLIRNLRSEGEFSWQIITDMDKLANLALLQENLLWFSKQLQKFMKNFYSPRSNDRPDLMKSDSTENKTGDNGLRKVIKEYEDFADTCLLALHLEVRARCFHYLLPFSSPETAVESSFFQQLDTAVKHLTSDLLQIDEVLLPILSPKEFKYVFEGLGELVASLMVLIVSNMHRIRDGVVMRLDRNIFTIQCCLANITMSREVSFERARSFIDLLKSSPEEILDHIVEEGPRFNEQEYSAVLRLLSASTANASLGANYYEEKLKSIFARLADGAKNVTTVP